MQSTSTGVRPSLITVRSTQPCTKSSLQCFSALRSEDKGCPAGSSRPSGKEKKKSSAMTEVRRRGRSGSETLSNGATPTVAPVEEIDVTGSENADAQGPASVPIEETIVSEKAMAALMTVVGITIGLFFIFLGLQTPIPQKDVAYAVMIDGGSTGTRAQVFSFREGLLSETKLFSSDTPIAALGYAPGTGDSFFKPLLDNVRSVIPGKKRQLSVPIGLRATGGLRLAGVEFSNRVLEEARKALKKSGFLVRNEYVSVLDNHAEGVGAWATTNFLRGHFNGTAGVSAGVAELGGASFQVVFESSDAALAAVAESQEKSKGDAQAGVIVPRVKSVNIDGSDRKLISISRQGLGMSNFLKKLYFLFDKEGVLEEENPCFRPGKTLKDKKLIVGVAEAEEERIVTINGRGSFENCVASAEITVGHFGPLDRELLSHAKGSELFAYAYIFDRTVKFGLPESPEKDELVTKGKEICEGADESAGWADEACAEYSYVYFLLRELTNDFAEDGPRIKLVQYIDGHMLGWPLGGILADFKEELAVQVS